MRVRFFSLFFYGLTIVMGLSAGSFVLAQDVKTASCNCTSDSQFAVTAEQAALGTSPFLIEGVQEIYVAHPGTREIQSFIVTREWVGSSPGIGDGYWETTVTPISGDPDVLDAMNAGFSAHTAVSVALNAGVHVDDLDISADIGSAVDLVGPDGTSVSWNRGALENVLEGYLSTHYSDIVTGFADDVPSGLLDILQAALDMALEFVGPDRVIWIEFGDDTRIKVNLENLQFELDGSGGIVAVAFDPEVDESSAQGPGLSRVPQAAGEFSGFGFSGSATTINSLGSLAVLFGGSFGFGNQTQGCEGSFDCEVVDDVLHCVATFSKEQLQACAN